MRLTPEQYNQITKHSKYHNVKSNGFDSKGEEKRYNELLMLERLKVISNLQRQVSYELQPSFNKNGVHYRAITYKADFVYQQDGKTIVEDYKGFRTDIFKMKQKMFEYKYKDLELKITI